MKTKPRCSLGAWALLCVLVVGNSIVGHSLAAPADASAEVVITETVRLPYEQLVAARARLQAGDTAVGAAVAQLDAEAKKLLKIKPYSVVNKKVLPASGNAHDYFSFAPYWWPNPETKDGMPWIQLDGKINPASRDKFSDKVSFNGLVDATHILSTAYFFTGNKAYAQKTAELVRVWFLDEATKMNPHLQYAQAIPGKSTGRGIGIIDTRLFYRVLDSILLVQPSGQISAKESAGLQQWFNTYLDWLLQSPLGIEERNTLNNHGTFYDFQVAAIARYVGRDDVVRETIARTQSRMKAHFDHQGKQKLELARTRPFHYSVFNLQAFFGVAHIAESIGVDLWQYPSTKQSNIKQGMDYLLTRMRQEKNWGGTEELEIEADIIVPLLPEYIRRYKLSPNAYADIAPASSQWSQCNLLLGSSFPSPNKKPSDNNAKKFSFCAY